MHGGKVIKLSAFHLQIFNLQRIFIAFQKTCTYNAAFHLLSKINSVQIHIQVLYRSKNMHEIMFHVPKTKEEALAKDVLACNSFNIITPYKNESSVLFVRYRLI